MAKGNQKKKAQRQAGAWIKKATNKKNVEDGIVALEGNLMLQRHTHVATIMYNPQGVLRLIGSGLDNTQQVGWIIQALTQALEQANANKDQMVKVEAVKLANEHLLAGRKEAGLDEEGNELPPTKELVEEAIANIKANPPKSPTEPVNTGIKKE